MFSTDQILEMARNAGFSIIDLNQLENFRNFAKMVNDKEKTKLKEENKRLSILLKRMKILLNDVEM